MPTLNKLEYLDETKHQIKEALNTNFNAQIQDADTFRSYVSKINNIYTNWPKVEGEDTLLTLNQTKKGLMNLDLKGNTYQYSTIGKNLFDNVYGQTGNVYTKNINASSPLGSVDCYPINLSPNTQYTLKIDMNGYQKNSAWIAGVCFENGDVISLLQLGSMADITTTTFTTDSTGVVYVGQRYGFTYGETGRMNLFLQTAKIQLEKGSTATEYEPYTNGASPNPDYPQEVHVVSGDNSIKVEGKNLCNGITQNYFVNQAATRCGYAVGDSGLIIEVDGVSDYTISSNTVQTRYRVGCLNEIPVEGGSNTIVYNSSNKDGTDDSVTINTNGYKYLVVNATDLTAIQIEKGTTATTYTPYVSQTYPINLGDIELCKIGDYQDRIAKSSGKNLFDKDSPNIITNKYLNDSGVETSDNNFSISDYIKVDANTVYSSQPFENKSACICFYNSSKTFLSSKRLTQIQPNFITPNNCEYIRVSIWKADINIIQIEKGSTATSYEPFGKVWYLNKKIGKVVLDGSETGWKNDSLNKLWGLTISDILSISSPAIINGYCNYFIPNTLNSSRSNPNEFSQNGTYIWFNNQNLTLEGFKTWLSTHNTIVYYVLETPTITEITDTTLIEQLNNIEKAYSYDTQTNISQTNDNLGFIISASALMKGGN